MDAGGLNIIVTFEPGSSSFRGFYQYVSETTQKLNGQKWTDNLKFNGTEETRIVTNQHFHVLSHSKVNISCKYNRDNRHIGI